MTENAMILSVWSTPDWFSRSPSLLPDETTAPLQVPTGLLDSPNRAALGLPRFAEPGDESRQTDAEGGVGRIAELGGGASDVGEGLPDVAGLLGEAVGCPGS